MTRVIDLWEERGRRRPDDRIATLVQMFRELSVDRQRVGLRQMKAIDTDKIDGDPEAG